MVSQLEQLLDECLSQLNNKQVDPAVDPGKILETILSRYPEQAEELRPALRAALAVRRTPQPVASPQAREAGKARLLAAVAAREAEFERILDESLAAMARGETDLATVLEQYPEFAPRLRPILHAAQVVRSTPEPVPSVAARAAGKRELLVAVARKRQERAEPSGIRRYVQSFLGFLQGFGQPAFSLRRATVAILAVVVFLTTTSYGVTQVAASSLPDSPLYPVKLATEGIELALTPTPAGRVRLLMTFSERRLEEAAKTAATGRGLDRALAEMVKNNAQAMQIIAQLPVAERPPLLADFAELASKERKLLGQVKPLVPESERSTVEQAIFWSAQVQAQAEEAHNFPRRIELLVTTPAPTLMLLPTETQPAATWTPVPPIYESPEPKQGPIRTLPSPTLAKPAATPQPRLPTATSVPPEPTLAPPQPTPTQRIDFSVDQPRPGQKTPTPVPPSGSPLPGTTPTAQPPQPTDTPPIHVPTVVPPTGMPEITPTPSQ